MISPKTLISPNNSSADWPRRVIYVSQGNVPSRWAHTIQTMKMSEALARRVHDFRLVTQSHWRSVLCARPDYETLYGIRDSFRIDRLPGLGIPQQGPIDGYAYPRFDRLASLYAAVLRPDVVYTRGPYVSSLCVRARIDTVVEAHYGRVEDWSFQCIARASQDRHLIGVVTISDELAQLYGDAGIPREKILAWPDAVDLASFDGLPDKVALRRRLNLDPQAFIATYCGHLYDGRGVEDILSCAATMKDVQFLLVGGWDKDIVRWKQAAAGLVNVTLAGFVDNRHVPAYLRGSDVLLMPYSRTCNWSTGAGVSPMKLFEGMAARTPIVGSSLPSLKRHLVDGTSALLVESDCPSALANAIARLRGSPELGKRLADAAYRDVQHYTWDARALAVLEHCRRLRLRRERHACMRSGD